MFFCVSDMQSHSTAAVINLFVFLSDSSDDDIYDISLSQLGSSLSLIIYEN